MKIHPYYVKKQCAYTIKGLHEMTKLDNTNDEEKRDSAVMQFSCYSGLRMEDMHKSRSINFTKEAADQINPRSVVAVLAQTKNDKTGTGPVAGRTFVVPCICMPLNAVDKKKWCKSLLADPFTPCIDHCPYNVITTYLEACPTPDKETDPPLAFVRALATRGDRCLAKGPLGYSEIMKIPERVNQRLSEPNRVKKATGKAGRMTFTTLAMNETNVGGEVTAAATKHRDPKTCMGYVKPDNSLLMRAALGIGEAAKGSMNTNRLAGIDLTPPKSTELVKRTWQESDDGNAEIDGKKENVVHNKVMNVSNITNNEATSKSSIAVTTSDGGNKTTTVNLTFNF